MNMNEEEIGQEDDAVLSSDEEMISENKVNEEEGDVQKQGSKMGKYHEDESIPTTYTHYTDDDVRRFASRVPYCHAHDTYPIVIDHMKHASIPFHRFMERNQPGWIEWAREIVQSIEGYSLADSEQNLVTKNDGLGCTRSAISWISSKTKR